MNKYDTLYYVRNIKTGEALNYASYSKKWFSKAYTYYVVESPFPTLRPKSHFETFKKWILNTPNPDDYKIVKMREVC